jgi:hypothetical protein
VVATTTAQLAFAQTENRNLGGQQVQLPNDVEQKASYCLAVLKLQYSEAAALESKVTDATNPDARKALEAGAVWTKKHAEKLNDNINRIESFLLPRLPYLEPTAVLTAYYRGEADIRRQRKESQVTKCIDKCKNTGFSERCMRECMEADELNRRIFQCRDLSFLPY